MKAAIRAKAEKLRSKVADDVCHGGRDLSAIEAFGIQLHNEAIEAADEKIIKAREICSEAKITGDPEYDLFMKTTQKICTALSKDIRRLLIEDKE